MTEDGFDQTDSWYREQGGYSYSDEQVDRWLNRWFLPLIQPKPRWKVLDLACGDGAWSFGLGRAEPSLHILGVDLSTGGIEAARNRTTKLEHASRDNIRFERHDIERLPADCTGFDLVFARGLHIFNQHDMTHPGCIALLDSLHSRLSAKGVFFSSYGGRPQLEGQYTPASEIRLPLNRRPRTTAALDFRGGKFNHSQKSFLAPFLDSANLVVHHYRYSGGRHACVSGLRPLSGDTDGAPRPESRC